VEKAKGVLGKIMIVISIMGLVTFSLFIMEEAYQTVMFGTWAAQDAKDWELVYEGAQTMSGINKVMKRLNYIAGWIQPFAFFAYRSYGKAADYYVKALKTKVFANRPSIYVGRYVEFNFIPERIQIEKDYFRLINGRIHILKSTLEHNENINQVMKAKGILRQDKNIYFIDMRKKNGKRPNTDDRRGRNESPNRISRASDQRTL